MMIKLVLVISTLTLVLAQEKRCCTPKKWEGNNGGVIGFVKHGRAESTQFISRIAFDADNERVFSFINSTTGRHRSSLKIIQDFKKKVQYIIDMRTHKCMKTKLERPFNRGCIPAESKGPFKYNIGLPSGDHMSLRAYEIFFGKGRNQLKVDVSITKQCIPVGEIVMGRVKGVQLIGNIGFMGITTGIKDPSIFKPPASCQQNATMNMLELHPSFEYRTFHV